MAIAVIAPVRAAVKRVHKRWARPPTVPASSSWESVVRHVVVTCAEGRIVHAQLVVPETTIAKQLIAATATRVFLSVLVAYARVPLE